MVIGLMGKDSVDEFLFSAKAGFCEHFASAFVFLMRAAGVPARVVTGYQGGDLNPIDRIITVRQSDAHAWAEVYLPRRGWIRVDPTAAAIPGRVASGLARALPQDVGLPLMMRPQFQWLRALRYRWEVLAHKWNVWVLDYNPDRQRDLMAYFGMRDADWRYLTATLFTILGVLTALLLALFLMASSSSTSGSFTAGRRSPRCARPGRTPARSTCRRIAASCAWCVQVRNRLAVPASFRPQYRTWC